MTHIPVGDSLLHDENWQRDLDKQTVTYLESELQAAMRSGGALDSGSAQEKEERRKIRQDLIDQYACALIRKPELTKKSFATCIMFGNKCRVQAAKRIDAGELVITKSDEQWHTKEWPDLMNLFTASELNDVVQTCSGSSKVIAGNILSQRPQVKSP